MAKDPAFLLYSGDLISGTQHMSCAELGAYVRLLCFQHKNEKIPNIKDRLIRIIGASDNEYNILWPELSKKFDQMVDQNGEHLVNHKLQEVVDQRSKSKPKKIAAACLAGLISTNKKLNKQQIEFIKKSFEIKDFIDFEEKQMKEEIKKWLTKMVDQMVGHSVDNLENENIYNNINKVESINTISREEKKIEENYEFVFCMEKIYQKSWEEYKSILNGQAKFLTEDIFINWKKFVELSNEKFTAVLSTKFVSPKDFGTLMNDKGFLEEKWEETLEAICATGIRPEHDLFFRIPQFMEIVSEKKNKKIKSNGNTIAKLGTSAARIAKLKNW